MLPGGQVRASSTETRNSSTLPARELYQGPVQLPSNSEPSIVLMNPHTLKPSYITSLKPCMSNTDRGFVDSCHHQHAATVLQPVVPNLGNIVAAVPNLLADFEDRPLVTGHRPTNLDRWGGYAHWRMVFW